MRGTICSTGFFVQSILAYRNILPNRFEVKSLLDFFSWKTYSCHISFLLSKTGKQLVIFRLFLNFADPTEK